MATPKNIKALFQRYLDNICTPSELNLLIGFFGTAKEQDLRGLITRALFEEGQTDAITPDHKKNLQLIYQNIGQSIAGSKQEHLVIPFGRKRSIWRRIAAAASILLFLSIGGYYIFHKQSPQQLAQNQIHNDIAPGSNKAILTLANGKQISLTDAKNGIISKEGNQLIQKASDGTVSYKGSPDKDQQLVYNTIVTPRGGQWSVILPDGTKVMLDAASSIKYPVSFADNERKVEITGQAYFEVVHNAAQPFRVITKGQVIEDIGTIFNINAYDDDAVSKTTLLEGAVKVSISDNPGVVLKPGQQTILQNNKLTISDANTDEALAWKNGYFSLNDEKIRGIMLKLSRWYDIEVEYRGNIPDVILGGEISRNTRLSQALKILEVANVHFIVEGKKIIVTP